MVSGLYISQFSLPLFFIRSPKFFSLSFSFVFFIAVSWLVSFLSITVLFFLASSVCLYQGCCVQFCSLDSAKKKVSFSGFITLLLHWGGRGMCLLIMWWNWMWQGYWYCSVTGQKQCHLIHFVTQHQDACDTIRLVWDRKNDSIEGQCVCPCEIFSIGQIMGSGVWAHTAVLPLFRPTWFLNEIVD